MYMCVYIEWEMLEMENLNSPEEASHLLIASGTGRLCVFITPGLNRSITV